MAKKSVYWPSIKSFIGTEFVDKAILDACGRLDVMESNPSAVPQQSFGNAASIVEALESLDESNADDSDRQGLAECLSLIDLDKYTDPLDAKPSEAAKLQESAKPQVEKKKRATKAKATVSEPVTIPEADLVSSTASITVAEENDAPKVDLEKVESPDTSDASAE